jgi:hypothetical protein
MRTELSNSDYKCTHISLKKGINVFTFAQETKHQRNPRQTIQKREFADFFS